MFLLPPSFLSFPVLFSLFFKNSKSKIRKIKRKWIQKKENIKNWIWKCKNNTVHFIFTLYLIKVATKFLSFIIFSHLFSFSSHFISSHHFPVVLFFLLFPFHFISIRLNSFYLVDWVAKEERSLLHYRHAWKIFLSCVSSYGLWVRECASERQREWERDRESVCVCVRERDSGSERVE